MTTEYNFDEMTEREKWLLVTMITATQEHGDAAFAARGEGMYLDFQVLFEGYEVDGIAWVQRAAARINDEIEQRARAIAQDRYHEALYEIDDIAVDLKVAYQAAIDRLGWVGNDG